MMYGFNDLSISYHEHNNRINLHILGFKRIDILLFRLLNQFREFQLLKFHFSNSQLITSETVQFVNISNNSTKTSLESLKLQHDTEYKHTDISDINFNDFKYVLRYAFNDRWQSWGTSSLVLILSFSLSLSFHSELLTGIFLLLKGSRAKSAQEAYR